MAAVQLKSAELLVILLALKSEIVLGATVSEVDTLWFPKPSIVS